MRDLLRTLRYIYIWKHSKIRNQCVYHVDAAIWSTLII